MHERTGPLRTTNQYPPYQRTREMSISDMLLENRIIFLSGPIGERVASTVIQQLLYLQSIRRDQDVNLYINSPGGLVDQTLAIYDTMQYIRPDITTLCLGQAASMGALLMAAGTKGKRYGLKYSRFVIHQIMSGVQGQAADIEIQAREILALRSRINDIYAKHTGQALDVIEGAVDRDKFMSSEEAKEFGLIDEVVVHRPPIEGDQKDET